MQNDDILKKYVAELDEKIDLLMNIDNKVNYNLDYESGYVDASIAIKNTAYTLANKLLRGN